MDETGPHTLRITGINVNSEGSLYTTVSDDGTLKVIDHSSGEVVYDYNPSAGALKQLVVLK